MSVDIFAISKARRVPCRSTTCGDDNHFRVGRNPKHRDRLKPGCYVVGRGGRRLFFSAGSYAAYDDWRRQLCQFALGVAPEDVWDHPSRFSRLPFVELIDFPDSAGGVIGPTTSAKLHRDFVAFAARAKEHFTSERPAKWMPVAQIGRKKRRKYYANQAGLFWAHQVAQAVGGRVVSGDRTNIRWMHAVYRKFRRAFRIAGDGGMVLFE